MMNFWNEALRRVQQLPGVEAAGFATILPLSGSNSDSSFSIEGRVVGKSEPGPDEEIRIVTPDYFRVLKTPLVRVVVTELRDQVFYARLIVKQDGHFVEVDARPSDAIAVAVRVECPIVHTTSAISTHPPICSALAQSARRSGPSAAP